MKNSINKYTELTISNPNEIHGYKKGRVPNKVLCIVLERVYPFIRHLRVLQSNFGFSFR